MKTALTLDLEKNTLRLLAGARRAGRGGSHDAASCRHRRLAGPPGQRRWHHHLALLRAEGNQGRFSQRRQVVLRRRLQLLRLAGAAVPASRRRHSRRHRRDDLPGVFETGRRRQQLAGDDAGPAHRGATTAAPSASRACWRIRDALCRQSESRGGEGQARRPRLEPV